jgi:type VI secretion system secreted protein Hcp
MIRFLVQALSHGMYIPPEGGYRMHKPLVITKIIDKSSPLINSALVTGEHLEVCRVDWYRTAAEGVQEHYYTMELEEALIIAVDVNMPHCEDPSKAHLGHTEEVHIAYRKITWTHHIAGTESVDQWRVSRNA